MTWKEAVRLLFQSDCLAEIGHAATRMLAPSQRISKRWAPKLKRVSTFAKSGRFFSSLDLAADERWRT